MKKLWLIYREADVEKNSRYIGFYRERSAAYGFETELMLADRMEFGVRAGKHYLLYDGEALPNPDVAVVRTIYPMLNRQLEAMKIPTFNNSMVSEICNDKARTCQYVQAAGVLQIDTAYYRFDRAEEILDGIYRPSVIKAVAGHGGSQVFYLDRENKTEIPSILAALDHSDFIVQPLVGSRHQDLRVYVIGRQIIGAVLRSARSGFKSNFSLGGEVCLYGLSAAETETVNRIIQLFDFGMVGIDFIIGDQGELIFNEIEDVVGARMLYQCMPGIDLVGMYLRYIKERLGA
ncbi:MAG: hypothetical protein J6B85_00750 [Lachnospiraceae bacterium]|nr:hypothetical protein [Lachnospiraceae bacterium]